MNATITGRLVNSAKYYALYYRGGAAVATRIGVINNKKTCRNLFLFVSFNTRTHTRIMCTYKRLYNTRRIYFVEGLE